MRHREQILRFVAAGAANTGLSYAVYVLFLWLGMAYPLANFMSLVAGMCLGFFTQGHFVFRRLRARRFPVFVMTSLAIWALNVGVIAALLPLTGGNAYAAGALALCFAVPLSYLVQKHLVFSGGSGR